MNKQQKREVLDRIRDLLNEGRHLEATYLLNSIYPEPSQPRRHL